MNYIEDVLIEGISRDVGIAILKSRNDVGLIKSRIRTILDACMCYQEIDKGSHIYVDEGENLLTVQFIPRLHHEWFNLRFTYGFDSSIDEVPDPTIVRVSTDDCASPEDAYDRAMGLL